MLGLRLIIAIFFVIAAAAGGVALNVATDGRFLPGGETDTRVEATPPPEPFEPTLEWAASGEWRIQPERDVWRNPVKTLEFFGVE
ncbi:MAG: hypothetical protein AAGB25_09465, partial [Pseudomonadota bacterium]